ncbi:hypothetical protein SAV14893_079880 [Streptomyces avermitilis]|nr:hypothetical protein SAV14893_079880 [Streptomyces avermitilis]
MLADGGEAIADLAVRSPRWFRPGAQSRRNELEGTVNALKAFRAGATRYDKRAFVFHGTVTVAAIRLWIRQ